MMARSKPCAREGCDELIVQQGNLAARFDAQVYCSRECNKRVPGAAKPRLTKPCAMPDCEGVVVQYGPPSKFHAQRYCSRRCSGAAIHAGNRKPPPEPKTCQHAPCGRQIVSEGRRSSEHHKRRKYCSRQCSSAARAAARLAEGETPVRGRRRSAPRRPTLDQAALDAIGPLHGPQRPPWRPEGWASAPYIPERLRAA